MTKARHRVYTFCVSVPDVDEAIRRIVEKLQQEHGPEFSRAAFSEFNEIVFLVMPASSYFCEFQEANRIYKLYDAIGLGLEMVPHRKASTIVLSGRYVARALAALGIPLDQIESRLEARQQDAVNCNEVDPELDHLESSFKWQINKK